MLPSLFRTECARLADDFRGRQRVKHSENERRQNGSRKGERSVAWPNGLLDILGAGRPLFDPGTAPLSCELVEQATFPEGVMMHRYAIRH